MPLLLKTTGLSGTTEPDSGSTGNPRSHHNFGFGTGMVVGIAIGVIAGILIVAEANK